jgi:hypothetical protein
LYWDRVSSMARFCPIPYSKLCEANMTANTRSPLVLRSAWNCDIGRERKADKGEPARPAAGKGRKTGVFARALTYLCTWHR